MARWFVDRLPRAGHSLGEPAAIAPRGSIRGMHGLGSLRAAATIIAGWTPASCSSRSRRRGPAMTAIASCARRSSAARPASWSNSPAPKPGGFRSSSPTHVLPMRESARPSPATRRSSSRRWESPAAHGKTITALMIRSILEAAGDQFGLIGSSGFCDGTRHACTRSRVRSRPGRALMERAAAARTFARGSCSQGMALHLGLRGWRRCSPRWSIAVARERSSKSRALHSRIAASKEWPSTRPWSPISPVPGLPRRRR